uniref:Uncharacterized protein n=1 Tax=Acrobeloides nanus TaxID=290746 RepID=A0A914CAZ5_9BILA
MKFLSAIVVVFIFAAFLFLTQANMYSCGYQDCEPCYSSCVSSCEAGASDAYEAAGCRGSCSSICGC